MFVAGRILSQKSPSVLSHLRGDAKFSNILIGSKKPPKKNRIRRKFRWYVPFVWQAFLVTISGILLSLCGLVMCVIGFYSSSYSYGKHVHQIGAIENIYKKHNDSFFHLLEESKRIYSDTNDNLKPKRVSLYKNQYDFSNEPGKKVKSIENKNILSVFKTFKDNSDKNKKVTIFSLLQNNRSSFVTPFILHQSTNPKNNSRLKALLTSHLHFFKNTHFHFLKAFKPLITNLNYSFFNSGHFKNVGNLSNEISMKFPKDMNNSTKTRTPKSKLRYLSYIGPITMSVGSFFVVFACVVVCEARDQLIDDLEKEYGDDGYSYASDDFDVKVCNSPCYKKKSSFKNFQTQNYAKKIHSNNMIFSNDDVLSNKNLENVDFTDHITEYSYEKNSLSKNHKIDVKSTFDYINRIKYRYESDDNSNFNINFIDDCDEDEYITRKDSKSFKHHSANTDVVLCNRLKSEKSKIECLSSNSIFGFDNIINELDMGDRSAIKNNEERTSQETLNQNNKSSFAKYFDKIKGQNKKIDGDIFKCFMFYMPVKRLSLDAVKSTFVLKKDKF